MVYTQLVARENIIARKRKKERESDKNAYHIQ